MHVNSPIFQGLHNEKKIRPITLIVWVLGRDKKMNFFCFKLISKCDTCFFVHVSTAFQKYRSVALVTKKLWAILDFFFTDRTFFRPVPYPIN